MQLTPKRRRSAAIVAALTLMLIVSVAISLWGGQRPTEAERRLTGTWVHADDGHSITFHANGRTYNGQGAQYSHWCASDDKLVLRGSPWQRLYDAAAGTVQEERYSFRFLADGTLLLDPEPSEFPETRWRRVVSDDSEGRE